MEAVSATHFGLLERFRRRHRIQHIIESWHARGIEKGTAFHSKAKKVDPVCDLEHRPLQQKGSYISLDQARVLAMHAARESPQFEALHAERYFPDSNVALPRPFGFFCYWFWMTFPRSGKRRAGPAFDLLRFQRYQPAAKATMK